MKLNFAPNLSTLYQEVPFTGRFAEAKKNGFSAVEFQNAFGVEPSTLELAVKRENLKVVLLNSYPGSDEDFGLAAIPGKEMEFASSINETLKYTFPLRCEKVHILAGLKTQDDVSEDHYYSTYISNLQYAADVLEEHDIIGLIEPICSEVIPKYYLSSFDTAVKAIEDVNSKHIRLLLDVYHLHKITNDVEKNLGVYYPYAGHIQISQDPGRVQPFQPGGIINYKYVLEFLKSEEYNDYIGLEYFTDGPTVNSFEWLKNCV